MLPKEIQAEIDGDPMLRANLQTHYPVFDSRAVPENEEAAVTRLCGLSLVDYDRVREVEAKALNIRVATLDKLVKSARQGVKSDVGDSSQPLIFEEVEAWPDSVNGAELLTRLSDTVRRFIVCDPETARTAALWITFTWLIDVVQVAPIAMITAPEKRCGKTQLLSLFRRLCIRPIAASNITASAIFRCIEMWRPTLLIDEADAFLRDNEDARGILNSGHTRDTAYVIRVVGDNFEPRRFSTWGAKAIAGIGRLADTLSDRAIPLELRRKLPGEQVEILRHAEPGLFEELRQRLARWTVDNADAVRTARPCIVDALNDRAQDNWEPLLAVADVAGGEWPALARKAAVRLSGVVQESPGINAELLGDIRDVFDHKQVDRLSTADLIEALTEDEEKPWATWNRGKPISPHQLAKRLREFSISPNTIRTAYGNTAKGYRSEQFTDAFARYLFDSPTCTSVTPSQPNGDAVSDDFQKRNAGQKLRIEKALPRSNRAGCDGVTDRDGIIDEGGFEEFDI